MGVALGKGVGRGVDVAGGRFGDDVNGVEGNAVAGGGVADGTVAVGAVVGVAGGESRHAVVPSNTAHTVQTESECLRLNAPDLTSLSRLQSPIPNL